MSKRNREACEVGTYFSRNCSGVEDAFDQFDVDDSGYLDQHEVEQAIALLGASIRKLSVKLSARF